MEFVDNLGHIFSLPSYYQDPVGYEYNENNYVFWFAREYNYSPSVNNYYFKQINVFLLDTNVKSFNVKVKSDIFSLLSYKKINALDDIHKSIEFRKDPLLNERGEIEEDSDFKTELNYKPDENINDFNIIRVEDGLLISFYVVAYAKESAVWESNILLSCEYPSTSNEGTWFEYCPITVGIETIDECEELVINGKNMGVSLPKEIIKAVYQTNYYSENPDESLYKAKLKEYLMNYMSIKGQQGNMKSIKDSLAWFGWGDKITISKLIKTDVDLHNIYIRDYFDIESDIIYQYKCFKNTSLISLSLQGNEEIGEEDHDFNNEFWGEAKPFYRDLFEKEITVNHEDKYIDSNNITEYKRAYYDYSINEIGLKLCILKYYFEKYFVPLHVKVNTVSVEYKCHMNDIKYMVRPYTCVNETPLFINNYVGNTNIVDYIAVNSKEIDPDNIVDYYIKDDENYILVDKDYISVNENEQYYKQHNTFIKFPNTHILYFNDGKHYVDENFNEFFYYENAVNEEIGEDIYYIDDTVITIPIDFPHNIEQDQIFECVMFLMKDNKEVFNHHFTFCEKAGDPDTYYRNLILRPASFNKGRFDLNNWLDSKYKLSIFINGAFYEYEFEMRMPDFYIRMGKLEYQWDEKFNTFEGDRTYMYNTKLVTINNIDFNEDYKIFKTNNEDLVLNLDQYFNRYYTSTVNITNNKKYFNMCHLLKGYDPDDAELQDPIITDNYSIYKVVEYKDGMPLDLESLDEYAETYPDQVRTLLVSKLTLKDLELLSKRNNIDIINTPKELFNWIRSDYKVLINRLIFKDTDIEPVIFDDKYVYNPNKLSFANKNVFENDDIIAFYLLNNENLYYKLRLGTKWHIEPMSLRMSDSSDVESPNEMAIVSVGRDNIRYEKGYYNITCRYSLDDFIQHEYTATAKFKVK